MSEIITGTEGKDDQVCYKIFEAVHLLKPDTLLGAIEVWHGISYSKPYHWYSIKSLLIKTRDNYCCLKQSNKTIDNDKQSYMSRKEGSGRSNFTALTACQKKTNS